MECIISSLNHTQDLSTWEKFIRHKVVATVVDVEINISEKYEYYINHVKTDSPYLRLFDKKTERKGNNPFEFYNLTLSYALNS